MSENLKLTHYPELEAEKTPLYTDRIANLERKIAELEADWEKLAAEARGYARERDALQARYDRQHALNCELVEGAHQDTDEIQRLKAEVAALQAGVEAAMAVCREAADHLYNRQDMDRCREMARNVIAEARKLEP